MTTTKKLGYRPPIDPFIRSQAFEQFVARPHSGSMKITYRQMLEAVKDELGAELATILKWYGEAVITHSELDGFMQRVQANNMSWDGLGDDFAARFYEVAERERNLLMQCELTAEHILLTLDSLITTLVYGLTGKDKCIDVGMRLPSAGGVYFDRLLDASGNFLRHRSEWRQCELHRQPLTPQQRDSILPLGMALSNEPKLSDRDARTLLFSLPQPMFAVLDIVADYWTHAEALEYEVIHDRCVELGNAIIEARFAAWDAKRRAAAPTPQGKGATKKP